MMKKLWSFFIKKKEDKQQFVKHMQRLRLEKNDVLVIESSEMLTQASAQQLTRQVKDALAAAGYENKVMILDAGLKIGDIGKGRASNAEPF